MKNNNVRPSFLEGALSQNPVFAAGMGIAPAIFMSSTLSTAVTYAAFFSAVTFLSLIISSFVPRKFPYALRIILYTISAAAVYIPVYIFFDTELPASPEKLGVFLPMIVTGEFVVSASEMRFFRMKKLHMAADVFFHIIGFDAAMILMGAFRELFATGSIGGVIYGISHTIPLLSAPCSGFILIALCGAFIRILAPSAGKNNEVKEMDDK